MKHVHTCQILKKSYTFANGCLLASWSCVFMKSTMKYTKYGQHNNIISGDSIILFPRENTQYSSLTVTEGT